MSNQPFLATIIGIPHIPSVREVNIRSGPSTTHELIFKATVGSANLRIVDVREDSNGNNLAGKVYQWFQLMFTDSTTGWVRDDLIEVIGDGTRAGYTVITTPTLAFNLTRRVEIRPGQEIVTPGVRPAPSSGFVPLGVRTQTVTAVQPTTPAAPVAQPTTPAAPAAQPAQPAQPAAAPAPTTPPPEPAAPTGPARAVCMGRTGANVRPGPGTQHNPPVLNIPYLAEADILEAKQGDAPGDPFKWVRIAYQGKQGWIREDFIRLKGSFGQLGVAAEDLYPSCIPDSWWVRDYNLDPSKNSFVNVHWGWDHAANVGSAILAGPRGGFVVKAATCRKCGPNGASAVDMGFGLSDSRVLNDDGWNYGYGHYVIVRYNNDLLPESTRKMLEGRGLGGAHAFVMYAHLHQISVQEGQTLQPGQLIGTCGNSGNSSGAHLHLELRYGKDINSAWARLRENLMSPGTLYLR